MGSLATLIPVVAPEVPGAPEVVMTQQISLAARDFCTRTSVWQNELSPFDIVSGVADYDLDPELDDTDADADVITIVKAKFQDHCLQGGHDYIMNNVGQLHLRRTPTEDIDGGLTVTIALRPVFGGDYIDDLILARYFEQLSYGAKALLMIQSKKPWTNPQMAAYYGSKFSNAVSELRFDIARGLGTSADLTIRQRIF